MNEGVMPSADFKIGKNGRKYPAKRIHMGEKEQVQEASYRGNIGVMELAKFHSSASPSDKEHFTQLMRKKSAAKTEKEQQHTASQIWDHVQKVTGTKLHQMESTAMISFKLMLESNDDFILQTLADKDINASIKDGKVVVHDHSQHAKAKNMVKRMGMPHEVVKGLKEDLDESSDKPTPEEVHNFLGRHKNAYQIRYSKKFTRTPTTQHDIHIRADNEEAAHAVLRKKHRGAVIHSTIQTGKGVPYKDTVKEDHTSTVVQEAMPTHEFNKLVHGYLKHKKAAKIGGFKPMSIDQYKRVSVKALSVREDTIEEAKTHSVGDVIHIHHHSIAGKDYHGSTNIDKVSANYIQARHPETNEMIRFHTKTKTQVGSVAGSRAGAFVFSTSKNEENLEELSKNTLKKYQRKAMSDTTKGKEAQRMGGVIRSDMKIKAKETVKESDETDTVTMDVPLLTRVLEMAREDIKSDEQLHVVVTRLIEMAKNGTLSMENYKKLTEDNKVVVPMLKPRNPNQMVLAAKKNAAGPHRDKKREMKGGASKHRNKADE